MDPCVDLRPDGVYLSGEKFFLASGDFHYFRTLPEGWRRRLDLMRDFGLTAVTTYVPWNLHEPRRGAFCFEGNADLPRFLQTAAEAGLKVILRCSPYMCGEWEMGGLPSWLLKDRTVCLRSTDPAYMDAVRTYSAVLIEKIRPYLYKNGGPIILIGVENEYGSFGSDKAYLRQLADIYIQAEVDLPLISANGSDPFKFHNGTLPENWNGIDCGAYPNSLAELDFLQAYQPNKPLMIGEAWDGNIQFWGKNFALNTNIEPTVDFYKQALERGVVVNFYMFCGGTNFGFTSGAEAINDERSYMPLMTSYDYDAPISEEGTPREKYFALRDVLDDHLGRPRRSHTPPHWNVQTIDAILLNRFANLLDNTAALAESVTVMGKPQYMEDLDQDYGFIRYTTRLPYTDDRVRHLRLEGLADRATIYLNGVYAGCYMRDQQNDPVTFTIPPEGLELSVLVENMGRINYGYKLYDRKGLDHVRTDIELPNGKFLYNFTHAMNFVIETLPLRSLEGVCWKDTPPADGLPVLCQGTFTAKPGVDTFVDMRGWNKGVVFVNGFNLGRYWHIGPQQTLYLPGELLKEENTITILELHYRDTYRTVRCIDHAILDDILTEDLSAAGFELK